MTDEPMQVDNVEIVTLEDVYEKQAKLQQLNKEQQQGLPPRAYLDETVASLVLEGFKALVNERPPNPCEYLGLFLLKNSSKFDPQPGEAEK